MVKAAVVLVLLWCGWWFVAATVIERSVANWLADQRTQGWEAKIGSTTVSGFPFALNTILSPVSVANPARAIAMQSEQIDLSAPAYWPGHLTLNLPDSPITLSAPNLTVFVKAQDAQATLRLNVRSDLELGGVAANSGPWQINTPQGNVLSAQAMHAEMAQDDTQSATYRFSVNAEKLSPGDPLRALLQLPPDWPLTFDAFAADGAVTFDHPLNRFAAELTPQPRVITLSRLEVAWGALRLSGQGALNIDIDGVPEGEVLVTLDNWRQAVDLVEQSGAINPNERRQAELLLTALASRGDNPDTLNLPLTIRSGAMFLSGIPLGPAPRLLLR